MARRGSFGRLPRAVPSLTNTLVAIAREQEQRRDQNIVDAWKNGGLFEGDQVTDDMILDHFRERLNDVSEDDPIYDSFKTAVMQFEYTIAQSKKSLLHAQGKISDQQMAAFYLGWAKKVPDDSEFDRQLKRDAAMLVRKQAVAKQDHSAEREEKKYQNSVDNIMDTYIKPGEYLTNSLRTIMQDQGWGDGEKKDFTGFDPSDPSLMLGLLEKIKTTGNAVLFYDGSTAVTGNDFIAKMQKLDPSFTMAKLTPGTIKQYQQDAASGYDKFYALANKTGHAQDANTAESGRQYFNDTARDTGAWGAQQEYESEYFRHKTRVESGAMNGAEIIQEDILHKANLSKILSNPLIKDNLNYKNRLQGEIDGSGSIVPLSDDFTGLDSANFNTMGGGTNTVSKYEEWVNKYREDAQFVATGEYVYTTGTRDPETNVFVAGGGGSDIGVAPAVSIIPNGVGSGNTSAVPVPAGDGKNMITVYAENIPVYATAYTPDGKKITADNEEPIGYIKRMPIGGVLTTMYGVPVQVESGHGTTQRIKWSVNSFLDDGLTPTVSDEKGRPKYEVNVTAKVQFDDLGNPVADGKFVTLTTMSDGSQQYRLSGQVAALDPSIDATNGYSDEEGSFSPILAFMKGTKNKDMTTTYHGNQAAMKQGIDDLYKAHGAVWEDSEGKHGWVGGDQAGIAKDLYSLAGVPGLRPQMKAVGITDAQIEAGRAVVADPAAPIPKVTDQWRANPSNITGMPNNRGETPQEFKDKALSRLGSAAPAAVTPLRDSHVTPPKYAIQLPGMANGMGGLTYARTASTIVTPAQPSISGSTGVYAAAPKPTTPAPTGGTTGMTSPAQNKKGTTYTPYSYYKNH